MSMAAIRFISGVLLALAGMVGLHFGVEYSGWVLFVGLFVVLFA